MPRSLSWSAALRDVRHDRAAPSPVREERLRTTAGLRSSPALNLTAWRGRSGRRYVASIVDALDPEAAPAVVLGVHRDAAGIASILFVSDAVDFVAPASTTELHIHRLAATAAERAAIVADLR